MKYLLSCIVTVLILLIVSSCKKTSFVTSPSAFVTLSADTLHFDTVFTTTGSVTQSFKIFNRNDQKLRLSNIKLFGGNQSSFKINVDGTPGTSFQNVEMEPDDSLYVFVSVTINPNAANLPFVVRDSILIGYNGTEQLLQLEAYGQNANFFRQRRITSDTVWKNDLPFVILGQVSVDSNATLTLEKGCRVYCHADAPFIVNGSLQVNGEAGAGSRVAFTGDRRDPGYEGLPGSWPGIAFSSSSTNNELNYAVIRDAYQGVIAQGSKTGNAKITLNQCIIFNVSDAGILSNGSSIDAVNCLIANCGTNISIKSGGSYSFDQCTVTSYGSQLVTHKNPVLSISNSDSANRIFPLDARFRNCIFYGEGGPVDNEILVDKQGSPSANDYRVVFENVLYKNQNEPAAASFTNPLNNQPPEFDSVDVVKGYYDFHLKRISPAINAGANLNIPIDLDGNTRGGVADLGCYEQ